MILQSLRELALREGLVDDPAFESKPVRWIIELFPDGRFLNLIDTNSPETLPADSKRKPRMEAKLMVIPRRQVRPGKQIKPNFLVDNAKYVLGDGETESDAEKLCQSFLQSLGRVQATVTSIELDAVIHFLGNPTQKAQCLERLATYNDFADNDLFTFEVDGFSLHQVEELRLYWAHSVNVQTSDAPQAQCLVCGQLGSLARLHNQIQIRGASTAGVPLVSFNSGAFEKYGWSANENAPICTICMTAYVEALRRMTRARYDNPRGERMTPLSIVLTGDTTAVYWADNDDPILGMIGGVRDDPKRVEDLVRSPRKGTETGVRNAARFFCLILTGVQGRAIVRRVHTGTVAEVEQNLRRYFAAIHIARYDEHAPIPQFLLLKSLVLNGELDRLPAELGTELWLSALFGVALSRQFLSTVVTRNRVEAQDLKKSKWKVGRERAALIQLYFTSNNKQPALDRELRNNGAEEAPWMGLNESSNDRAYVLGRVLAVAERMQLVAQPQGLNRTLVDRFYAMASVRPKVVFNELIKLYAYHRSKAMRDSFYLAKQTDELWGELLFKLNVEPGVPEDDAFALSFTLEEQGRFGLGYFHQRQDFANKMRLAIEEKARRAAAAASTSVNDSTLSTEETAA